MSQIEQDFRQLLSKKPEIEKCYAEGLINRRALARYLVKQKIAERHQMEATIAMLRRFEFTPGKSLTRIVPVSVPSLFHNARFESEPRAEKNSVPLTFVRLLR